MAQHYYKIKRPDSAILYATHAFESARRTPTLQVVSDAGFLLKKIYAEQNNYAKALYFNDLATIAKDSLINVDKLRQVQALTQPVWERMYLSSLETLNAKNIELNWQMPPENDLPDLPFDTKRHLFLAYKEAINNIVKHAGAPQYLLKVRAKTTVLF